MVPGALNLALNLYYIPLQGAFAAAWTTAVSFGVFALLSYAVSRTYYQFDKEGSLLGLLILGTCVGLC